MKHSNRCKDSEGESPTWLEYSATLGNILMNIFGLKIGKEVN